MGAYIVRKLLYGIAVLWGVATLVFFLFNILPGDPAQMMLGQRADQESVNAKALGNNMLIILMTWFRFRFMMSQKDSKSWKRLVVTPNSPPSDQWPSCSRLHI